jgi:transcriptional regulator with XRE-family HTH domain
MISPSQIRGARAMLGLNQAAVAQMSGLSLTAFSAIECSNSKPRARTLENIRAALGSAGVEFIDSNGGGPGVRLKASDG